MSPRIRFGNQYRPRPSHGALLIALAVITALSGGGPGQPVAALADRGSLGSAQTPEPPVRDCNLGFFPLKPTVGVGSILGNAWARCDYAIPEDHQFTLSLEILQKGHGWVPMATNPPDPRLPFPGGGKVLYEIKTKCLPGYWRVTATASGSLWGNPFEFTDHSIERSITAQDCARGSN